MPKLVKPVVEVIKVVSPDASADAKRRLRKSKEAERTVGRWLLAHDGADPRMNGIASSTLRTGHVTGMQIDVMSITYACEVKNIRVWASLWKFWNKIVDRAVEHGKEPLLVIIPTNAPLGLKRIAPAMHIITETRHAELLEAERIVKDRATE
jgi:hypothetical protein